VHPPLGRVPSSVGDAGDRSPSQDDDRRRRPTDRTSDQLDVGAAEIVVQLLAVGERGWAAMVQEGFEHPPGPLRSLYLGHALALVRYRSSQTQLRGDWSKIDQSRLQQLAVDYVAGWKPQRP
jgi:hypothetical protein